MLCVYNAKNPTVQNGIEQIQTTLELKKHKTLKHFLLAGKDGLLL
jgi:hypothetical protein